MVTVAPCLRRRLAPRHRVALWRVAFLINELKLGGTETQVCLLARELRARGTDVHVLVLRGGGAHVAALRLAGIQVHEIGFATSGSWPAVLAGALKSGATLVRLLRRLKPQVLHAFLYRSYVLGPPAARLAGVPIVVAGRRSQSFFKQGRRWVFALERAATQMTDHVIANAVAVAEDARTLERVPAHKLSVIYNGLPASAYERIAAAQIDTCLPVIVCVANLLPVKGHHFLLQAAAMLSQRGRACTLVFVGEGPEREKVEREASDLKVDVRFTGPVTDTRGLLARADVVVLPSLHEGLSNAIMEGMAAGRPIVGTAVGGTPELLDGRGLLVPPADSKALADAVCRLLDDPEFAASLAGTARAWARKNLDATVFADEHVKLYQRLLEARCVG
ncbi:glycosyltransferase [Nonomuraea sp. CA-141351]|uniref:glycosyltransferase n=1 Tax=Nonomuraea sp. CA-141351 TaxID=3239996 RepID=UPI003D944AFE